jgi:hypothetical protein
MRLMVGNAMAPSSFRRKLVGHNNHMNARLVSQDISDSSAGSIVQKTLKEPAIVVSRKDDGHVGGRTQQIVDVLADYTRDIAVRTSMDLQGGF